MSVAHQATGTPAAAGGVATDPITASPSWPTHTTGDLGLLIAVTRHDTEATPTVTAGGGETWELVGSGSGGGGTFGAGTGPARITVWRCVATSGSMAAPTVNLAGTNTGRNLQAVISTARKTVEDTYDTAMALVAEATAGTGWTQAHTSDPGLTAGDAVWLIYGVRDDQAAAFSAMGVSATGATFGSVTERADSFSSLGNDQGLGVGTADVTAGTASANATQTATIGSSESGMMALLRVREYTPTPPVDPQLDGAVVVAEANANAATTGARDVATDRAVWIFVTHNASLAGTVTSVVTDNSASITPALLLRRNTQGGTTAEIWRGYNSSGSTVSGYTVTATGSTTSGDVTRTHVVLAVMSGEEETAGGDIDGASSASGLPSVTLTTTRDESWVWAVKSDWSAGGTGTPSSGEELVDSYSSADYDSDVWRQIDHTASASTSVTIDETAPSAQNYNAAAVEIRQVEAGGQTVNAAQVTETETAQAVTLRETETAAQVTETESAQAVIVRRLVPAVQATETETAQAVTLRETVVLGQVVETETALAVSTGQAQQIPLAQVVETEAAQPVTLRKTEIVAQTTETEIAQSVTLRRTETAAQAIETETAQPVTLRRTVVLGQVVEAELAQPFAIAGPQTIPIAQVVETESAQSVVLRRTKSIGQSSEAESALTVVTLRVVMLGQVIETETLFVLNVVGGVPTFTVGAARTSVTPTATTRTAVGVQGEAGIALVGTGVSSTRGG